MLKLSSVIKSMLSVSLLASSLSLGACAADDDDDSLDPASCVDAKCDDNSASGFEVFKGQDGKYYFHLVATNGKISLRSQGYTTKAKAKKGVESVRMNGLDLENYALLEAANGEYYFNLEAGNGEVIATSETYTRKWNAERAIGSAMHLIEDAQKARAAVTGGAKFITFRGEDNQYYFHVRAKNGEIVLQSEGYAAPGSIETAIASIRDNAKIASRYEVLEAADGQYYFHLKAANGEIIARGETYFSKSNATKAVTSLVELFKSGLVADPKALPRVPSRSITEYPDLVQGLTDVANQAPVYFGFAEGVGTPSGADCSQVSASQAVDQLAQTVDAIDSSQTSLINEQFNQFLGEDSYKLCTVNTGTILTASSQQFFILSEQSGGPKFMFEVGVQN